MLFTLEIEGKERTFNFGMKFVREIDALNVIEVDSGLLMHLRALSLKNHRTLQTFCTTVLNARAKISHRPK